MITKVKLFSTALPVLKYFGAIVWRYRPSYVFLVAGNMLLRGLAPFVNMVMPKFIIDELLGQQRTSVLVGLVAAMLGANFVIYLINNLRDYWMNQANLFFDLKLEELIGQQAMEMDFEYTEDPAVLTQLQKAKTGVSWYSGGIAGISNNLTAIVAGFIQLAGTLYIILVLSPWLIGVLLAIVILSMFVTSKNKRAHVRFMKELVDVNRRFSYYFGLLKNFRYGKDIRLYDAADMLLTRVDQYINEDWVTERNWIAVWNRFTVMLTSLSSVQRAVLYGYLGLQALAGAITIGEFQMMINAAQAFVQSLSRILEQIIDIGKNTEFMNEYKAFMEYPSVKKSGTQNPLAQTGHKLELRNVSFKYPGRDELVLKKVSLQIPVGQRLAVVGPNGAGKTTFVKLLARLYDPVEGEILLDDQDIRQLDLDEYANLFAVVFQDFKLLSFSVRDNVVLGYKQDDNELTQALHTAGLADKIAALPRGVDTTLYKTFDDDGIEFSGGERQKLAIARAVYKNSPIVILDEPTAALDPVAEYEVYRHFDQLVGEKTAIYVSHRLSSCRFADKIAVFDQGEIVEYGSHDELLANSGLYAQMWEAQAQWYVKAG